MPNPWIALVPILAVVIFFVGFNWHFITSIGIGIILGLILFFKNIVVLPESNKHRSIVGILTKGTNAGMGGALVLTSLVGFGTVVQTTPIFGAVKDAILGLSLPPVVLLFILLAVFVILTGSASAGIRFGIGTFAELPNHMGLAAGTVHRISAFTAATFNLLPYTAIVFVVINLAGLPYKEGYAVIAKISFALMLISTTLSVILYAIFPNMV